MIGETGIARRERIQNAVRLDDIQKRDWYQCHVLARGDHHQFFVYRTLSSEFIDGIGTGWPESGMVAPKLHDDRTIVLLKAILLKRSRGATKQGTLLAACRSVPPVQNLRIRHEPLTRSAVWASGIGPDSRARVNPVLGRARWQSDWRGLHPRNPETASMAEILVPLDVLSGAADLHDVQPAVAIDVRNCAT